MSKHKTRWMIKSDIKSITLSEQHNYNPSQAYQEEDLDGFYKEGKFDGYVIYAKEPEYLAGYLFYITKDDTIEVLRLYGNTPEIVTLLLNKVSHKLNKRKNIVRIKSYDDELSYHKIYKDYGLKAVETLYKSWDYRYNNGNIYCDTYIFEGHFKEKPKPAPKLPSAIPSPSPTVENKQ